MNTSVAQIGTGMYTAAEAAKILRIPYTKSKYWFNYYAQNKLFESIGYQYFFEIKNNIAVDFLTLIEMYVFYALKEENMKTSKIIKFHKILSDQLNTPYPFASNDLYVTKDDLIFNSKNLFMSAGDLGQLFIKDFILQFYKKITFSNNKLAHKFYPLGKEKSIVINPSNQFGQPIVEGTNVLTATIYDYYLGNESIETIAKLFDLNKSNVEDAIEFQKAA